MSLDRNRQDIGYVLGRLFAVLEKHRPKPIPAWTPPLSTAISVRQARRLPYLVHWCACCRTIWTNWNLKDVPYNCNGNPPDFGTLSEISNHLNLEQQGLFAIGYYHETQFLFTKDALKTCLTKRKLHKEQMPWLLKNATTLSFYLTQDGNPNGDPTQAICRVSTRKPAKVW